MFSLLLPGDLLLLLLLPLPFAGKITFNEPPPTPAKIEGRGKNPPRARIFGAKGNCRLSHSSFYAVDAAFFLVCGALFLPFFLVPLPHFARHRVLKEVPLAPSCFPSHFLKKGKKSGGSHVKIFNFVLPFPLLGVSFSFLLLTLLILGGERTPLKDPRP